MENLKYIEHYFKNIKDILAEINKKEISKAINILFEAWKNDKNIYFGTYKYSADYNSIYSNNINNGTYGVEVDCYTFSSKRCPKHNVIKNNVFNNLDYGVYIDSVDVTAGII